MRDAESVSHIDGTTNYVGNRCSIYRRETLVSNGLIHD